MTKLAWLTDIHLNFLDAEGVASFIGSLAEVTADAFLLTGDIGEAPSVTLLLDQLDSALGRPIFFVLGNHDFYRGTISGVRKRVEALCQARPNLHWMPRERVVRLTEKTCLIGHDGWADGRIGDYWGSAVQMNDWCLIDDLAGFGKETRLIQLQALGDEAAAHLRSVLPVAVAEFKHIVVLTHVPPFRESCWHEGQLSDEDWLPHFTCKAIGDVLAEAMAAHPDRQMTILCGHTHGEGETQILPNLRVLTGGAVYGKPRVQKILEFG